MIPESLSPIANHLWQSTLFAGAAWLLTLALRKSRARVRHWIWVAASVKFLLPFSVLIALGSRIEWRTASAPAQSGIPIMIQQVSQPFTPPARLAVAARADANPVPAIWVAIWACGFLGIATAWWARWRRIRNAVDAASPVELGIPIPVVSSATLLEPGVFGVFRPVLLLPEGIVQRLTSEQLNAVIAHELCHVRHRDNLIALIHMLTETVLWFHPLVWWIGQRMVEERERACDEEVLLSTGEPRSYAEGILTVCKFYKESPLACVAGVTGANLRKRIDAIMRNRAAPKLNLAKKAVLATATMGAVAGPCLIGLMNAPFIEAQLPSGGPKFEVASIKLRKDCNGAPAGASNLSPGTLRMECMPVESAIESAYVWFAGGRQNPLRSAPMEGAPAWVSSDLYEINAKAEGAPSQEIMRGPMLAALLEDRFKLKIHRETREVRVYELTIAKGGPRLKPFDGSCRPIDLNNVAGGALPFCRSGVGPGTNGAVKLEMRGASLDEFSKFLSLSLDRQVVDKTGLAGAYDFSAEFTPDLTTPRFYRNNADPPGGQSIRDALQEQLGLKLESARGPGVFLVIDHIERPTEN